MRRRAIVHISAEVLERALILPPHVHVKAIIQTSRDLFADTFSMAVHGEGLPESCLADEGEEAVEIRYEDLFR